MVLRPHKPADFEPLWAFFQSGRAQYVAPVASKSDYWYGFGAEIASWDLYGTGSWAVDVDGAFAGQIGILQPPHFPELEIGWILFDGFEGRGVAHEGARLALDWYWANRAGETLVSYIDPGNARSIALAERLGAAHDPDAMLPEGESAEETLVYRHRRPA